MTMSLDATQVLYREHDLAQIESDLVLYSDACLIRLIF